MFDSPVLNVVIGLALIYLLYSLLVTILGEIVSTSLNLRAVLLRVAIERILNDGYYYRRDRARNFLSFVVKFIRWLLIRPHQDFKGSLAGRFYDHPSIKYLSKSEGRLLGTSRPSYLTDVYFADAIVRMLIEKGLGADDKTRIATALKLNTLHMQARTMQNIRSLHREADGDPEAFKAGLKDWYNETMDRTNGWYKRKMQLILLSLGLILSVAFNIDTIRIAQLLARDRDARDQLVNMGIAQVRDSARYAAFRSGPGAPTPSKAALDSGFARVTEDIHAANMVLGLGWGFDTAGSEELYMVDDSDAASYRQALELAGAMHSVFRHDSAIRAAILLNQRQADSIALSFEQIRALLRVARLRPAPAAAAGKQPMAELSGLQADSAKLTSAMQTNRSWLQADSAELQRLADIRSHNLAALNALSHRQFRQAAPKPVVQDGRLVFSGRGPYKGWRLSYVLHQSGKDYRLLGFLLTALMLSLGAPFWFDTLNKLVSLRGAGVRPKPSDEPDLDAKAGTSPHGPVAMLPAATVRPLFATEQDELVWRHRAELMTIPQVRAVFTTYNAARNYIIQINITEAGVLARVTDKLKELGFVLPGFVRIVVTGKPVASGPPRSVANANRNTDFGTLGCILKEERSPEVYVLSCWHVLKGDTDYDAPKIVHPKIIDDGGGYLADLETGGIWGPLDYGLARCRPNGSVRTNDWLKQALKLPSELRHRAVERTDTENNTPVRFFDIFSGSEKRGVLYGVCQEVQITYRDGRERIVQDVLVITESATEEKTISRGGNSGAILFDDAGIAVGMIIAGDANYTYAIQLSNLLNLHADKHLA